MKKKEKQNLQLLLVAAFVGFLGNYSANFLFETFSEATVRLILGITAVACFFGFLFVIHKFTK